MDICADNFPQTNRIFTNTASIQVTEEFLSSETSVRRKSIALQYSGIHTSSCDLTEKKNHSLL